MKLVEAWTDGSAYGNPGITGAGIVMTYKGNVKEFAIPCGHGTSNTAELLAVCFCLEQLKEPCQIYIYTDSQYVQKCASGIWGRNSNEQLWQRYDNACANHVVTINWIRKDSHPNNQRAHDLANHAAQQTINE